ncbi:MULTISPECIES: slr1659 superfamily regulator [Rhizobium/Agrobacterium group]|uniref:slr1659 superfamily regulator n=1 Tax=Rhizobium/Agrobacterium group TaxID=227290 RepID=UPI00110E47D0|nr:MULTISPECIES: STAS domain-containing protein [Rhizobium/Agrobacterium group]NWJ23480.1 hypothetical protein [Rhizobium sp. RM]TMV19309.1 hypothetical protein BJG94_14530 [Rhizobium sp. Td3]UXS03986.1 hypothetical protein FY156_20940 [Agrobacterium tumefaciens]
MEISDENFRVWAEEGEVFFDGVLRLAGPDAYAPIYSLASGILAGQHNRVIFDITGLEFLNSSGINLLAKLTIEARKRPEVQLVIKGTSQYPWQTKSLPNLKKLYPQLDLQLV